MSIERQSLIRGVVQIMATGILAIGVVNAVVIVWVALRHSGLSAAISGYYPLGIPMSFPSALCASMTGLCLLLMSWNPRIKTKYFRRHND